MKRRLINTNMLKPVTMGPNREVMVLLLGLLAVLPPPRAFKHSALVWCWAVKQEKNTDACWLISKICVIGLARKHHPHKAMYAENYSIYISSIKQWRYCYLPLRGGVSCETPYFRFFFPFQSMLIELLVLWTVTSVCFSRNENRGLERASLSCPRPGLLLACIFLILETFRKIILLKKPEHLSTAWLSAGSLHPISC